MWVSIGFTSVILSTSKMGVDNNNVLIRCAIWCVLSYMCTVVCWILWIVIKPHIQNWPNRLSPIGPTFINIFTRNQSVTKSLLYLMYKLSFTICLLQLFICMLHMLHGYIQRSQWPFKWIAGIEHFMSCYSISDKIKALATKIPRRWLTFGMHFKVW